MVTARPEPKFMWKRRGQKRRAFKQIREKGYATPYLAFGQPINLIGLSFDPETRHLADAAAERY